MPSETFDRLDVDLTNPGQFYACCGLMEVAALLDPSVQAWFADGGFRMTVPMDSTLNALIDAKLEAVPLAEGSRRAKGGTPDKIAPVPVGLPTGRLVVDWWLDDGIADFKNWSGGQSASGAAMAMHAAMREIGPVPDAFDRAVAADAQPYYYDCRSGGNAIDRGFMDSNLSTQVYAATELLAFIGLQRFRPVPDPDGGRWTKQFASWNSPLSLQLARPVAACALPRLGSTRWRFEITKRDAEYRYKAFGRAEPQ